MYRLILVLMIIFGGLGLVSLGDTPIADSSSPQERAYFYQIPYNSLSDTQLTQCIEITGYQSHDS